MCGPTSATLEMGLSFNLARGRRGLKIQDIHTHSRKENRTIAFIFSATGMTYDIPHILKFLSDSTV